MVTPVIEDPNSEELETFVSARSSQVRYRCPNCQFDSHKKEGVLEHWLDTHVEKHGKNEPRSSSTLYDSENKPIQLKKESIYLPPALRKLL